MVMTPPRKSTSQAAVATLKGKSTAAGGVRPTDAHLSHLDVHIEGIREEHSFPTTALEEGINEYKTGSPLKVSSS